MASSKLISLLALFIMAWAEFGLGARFVTEPQPFNMLTDNKLNISCIADGPRHWAKTVVAMKINREGQGQSIISIRHTKGVVMGPDSMDSMKAHGRIDKDASKSFLTLSLENPRMEDMGIYNCLIVSLNEDLEMIKETVSVNVTTHDEDSSDTITDLTGKVYNLMQTIQDQGEVISLLNDTMKGQERQLLVLQDYVSEQEQRLEDFINKQNEINLRHTEQFNELDERIQGQKQKQKLDLLEHLTKEQNDTIFRQTQRIDELKDQCSVKEKLLKDIGELEAERKEKEIQFGSLNATIFENDRKILIQKEEIDNSRVSINKQRDIIEELKRHVLDKQACLDRGLAYYEADQTCLFVEVSNKKTWLEARKTCQTFGGDLVQIKDADKATFVNDLVDVYAVWTGLQRIELNFIYVDGSLLSDSNSLPWNDREPNNSGGKENCVELYAGQEDYTGKLNDKPCGTKLPFVCSTPIVRIDAF